eukprot:4727440-Pyramimonas_sp.AAC.5
MRRATQVGPAESRRRHRCGGSNRQGYGALRRKGWGKVDPRNVGGGAEPPGVACRLEQPVGGGTVRSSALPAAVLLIQYSTPFVGYCVTRVIGDCRLGYGVIITPI